ncbi:MAG: hypothetical protein R3F34_05700 [Planctomycetota bacterium]
MSRRIRIVRTAVAAMLALAASCSSPSSGTRANTPLPSTERFGALAEHLDVARFAAGYPALVARLRSDDERDRLVALKMLAGTDELAALPFVVEVMFVADDAETRAWAAAAFQAIVTTYRIRRRDPSRTDGVFFLPPDEEDVDLAPLAGVVEDMLELGEDDPNVASSALVVIGFLGFESFRACVDELSTSDRPAVANSALLALSFLDGKGGTFTAPELPDALGTGPETGIFQ